ncbi:MAG: hypothetical protein JW754_05250 [Candidatus Aenigmarchaeota archaeon]|nr:hypothetical protein [Candidatus Aenigmarchaeota archaeon]
MPIKEIQVNGDSCFLNTKTRGIRCYRKISCFDIVYEPVKGKDGLVNLETLYLPSGEVGGGRRAARKMVGGTDPEYSVKGMKEIAEIIKNLPRDESAIFELNYRHGTDMSLQRIRYHLIEKNICDTIIDMVEGEKDKVIITKIPE